jgi:hypothetical protein
MSFNISPFKNRDLSEVFVNFVGKDGKPLQWLKMSKKQREELKEEIELYQKGEYEGDALDKFKRPVRIKMKSPHTQAFNKAKLKRKVKDSMLVQGVAKEALKELEEGKEIDVAEFVNNATQKICDTVQNGVAMICELAVGWEGFTDGESDAEFDVEMLRAILSDPDHIEAYTHIIKCIDEKSGFFTE